MGTFFTSVESMNPVGDLRAIVSSPFSYGPGELLPAARIARIWQTLSGSDFARSIDIRHKFAASTRGSDILFQLLVIFRPEAR